MNFNLNFHHWALDAGESLWLGKGVIGFGVRIMVLIPPAPLMATPFDNNEARRAGRLLLPRTLARKALA